MANRLYVDKLVSIGLVEAGDNPEAEVLIYKSRPDEGSTMTKSAESAPTTKKVHMDLSAIEDQDLRKSVEDHIAGFETQISELEDKVEAAEPAPDPVEKADPEVQVLIKEQNDKIAELEADVTKERAARRVEEYVAKAKPLTGLLGKADEIGPVLAELSDKAPDAFDKLFSNLEAASQRTDLAKLFSELGTGEGEGESDPIAKRAVWVEKNRQDGETVESANSRFWTENPEAVQESRN